MYHAYFSYGRESQALRDVSMKADKGEFIFISGPSGAGKTTLLKLLFGQEKVTSGQILVGGRNITRLPSRKKAEFRRNIGVVFQDYKLLNDRSAIRNVSFALEVLGVPRREVKQRAWKALKQVQLHTKLDSLPLRLSGGEQQRIAIARALVNNPALLLADEPTGNLDYDITQEIMRMFLDINARGTTVMFATHDRELIRKHASRVIYLDRGRIVQQ